jgi:hypothetical protein
VRASLLRAEARLNVGRRRRRATATGRRSDSGESQ